MNLDSLGWTDFFQGNFSEFAAHGLAPARVALEHRDVYEVFSEAGEQRAVVSGRFRHNALCKSDFPTVGDWVALEIGKEGGDAIIQAVLPRRSKFSRGYGSKSPTEQERLIAVNIDTLCLVTGLDDDFNVRRIERYVTLAWDSGAEPVIVLNKADLCESLDERVAEVVGIAMGVPVHAVSAQDGDVESLQPYLGKGPTTAFVGSSGVGKSTLINCLIGDQYMDTGAVRDDDSRGRHTTSHRELIFMQTGGLLIDTPGMRELQMWGDDDGFKESFVDVEQLADKCRFNDCKHGSEPGCEVQAAIERGELERSRLVNYFKLEREYARVARKSQELGRKLQQEDGKRLAKRIKRATRDRGSEQEG